MIKIEFSSKFRDTDYEQDSNSTSDNYFYAPCIPPLFSDGD